MHLKKFFVWVGFELYLPSFLLTCAEETVHLPFNLSCVWRGESSEQMEGPTQNACTQAAEHILHAVRKKYLLFVKKKIHNVYIKAELLNPKRSC